MTIDACAALVERGDPERFRAAMAAPPAARPTLWPLYAFNLEVARAPWVTREPMIAEMRLQWWRDAVAEPGPRAHEVAAPFHALIRARALPLAVIDRLIAARRWDIHSDPFPDARAFAAYLEDTAAGLMWLAALALGAPPEAEAAARALGWAGGLASYLRAVPELERRGRVPLVDGRPAAVRTLAAEGLRRLAHARRSRRTLGPGAPALLAGWQAAALLKQIADDPGAVARGSIGLSEFRSRGLLLWQAATGRF